MLRARVRDTASHRKKGERATGPLKNRCFARNDGGGGRENKRKYRMGDAMDALEDDGAKYGMGQNRYPSC